MSCEDTRPQHQLNAATEQHKDLCNILQGASVTLHIILLGVGGTIYNTHNLKPFKELGLDSQRVKKLASKLHVHFVNFAAKLVHTRRALTSTVVNSHQQEPVSGQACNPLNPHWLFLPFSRWRSYAVLSTKVATFPLLTWGVPFHCLRRFFLFLTCLNPCISKFKVSHVVFLNKTGFPSLLNETRQNNLNWKTN